MNNTSVKDILTIIQNCSNEERKIYENEEKAFIHLVANPKHPMNYLETMKFYHLFQIKSLIYRMFDILIFEWHSGGQKKNSIFKYFDDLYWRIPELEGKSKSRFRSLKSINVSLKNTTFEHVITRNFVRNYIVQNLQNKQDVSRVIDEIFFLNKCVLISNEEDYLLKNQLVIDDSTDEIYWAKFTGPITDEQEIVIDFAERSKEYKLLTNIPNIDASRVSDFLIESFKDDILQRYQGCNIVIRDVEENKDYYLDDCSDREQLTRVLLNHIPTNTVLGKSLDSKKH